MFTEWIIDGLAEGYVNVLKRRYIEDSGEKLQVGQDWRTSAQNSAEGREFIKSIVPENFYASILAVWGDLPTIAEKSNRNRRLIFKAPSKSER